MKTARITATAAMGLMLFISMSIMLAVLLASPGSQADAPSSTLNISPVSEVLTGYTSSAADEILPTPANCSGCDSPNLVRRFLYNGEWVDEVVVPGPPQRPIVAESASGIEPQEAGAPGDVRLSNVPAFDWVYGCSATSAAMMFGYYDITGYPNMYAGPTNGGICPLNNSPWGWMAGECPLSATHQGYDNLSTEGHVDDYWGGYLAQWDPYFGNWTEHPYADCTGDYMGTNQWNTWGNEGGSTTFWYYTNCLPLYDYTGGETGGSRDGAHGMRLFVESRGYSLYYNSSLGEYTVFNQYIKGHCNPPNANNGFTYEQYKAEIDAGRPVLIQLDGHTMIGFGYNSSNNDIDIHDTWDYSDHVMTWGGSYGGMDHWGVTVLQMGSIPVTPTPSPTCTGVCPTPTPTATATPTATPACGWTVIMTEDFESGFPGSKWSLSGTPTWDDESYRPYNGAYSAWCAGSTLTPPANYSNNMNAWMVYGPFNLSDAFYADMKFKFWLNSQANDSLRWLASPNGSVFYGWYTIGNYSVWQNVTFDLTSVPTIGNLCGDPSVWIAILFLSNSSGTAEGAYVRVLM